MRKTHQGLVFSFLLHFSPPWQHGPPVSQHPASPGIAGTGTNRSWVRSTRVQVEITGNRKSNKKQSQEIWGSELDIPVHPPGSNHLFQTDGMRPRSTCPTSAQQSDPTQVLPTPESGSTQGRGGRSPRGPRVGQHLSSLPHPRH